MPHFPFLHLPGCQANVLSKQFRIPAVWYCCEVRTCSLAATLRWLYCCICSLAESRVLTHHFFSYLSFTGAKAGIFPSPCPHSYVNFQLLVWNEQGEKIFGKSRLPSHFGFQTDRSVNTQQWEEGDTDRVCWDHLSISQQEYSSLFIYCIFSYHKVQSK